MSNKTTLQSNNALLSQNNTDLQALINTANALPEAGGGGGSVETCTVKIACTGDSALYCTYTKYTEDGGLQFIAEVPTGVYETVDGIYADFFTLENIVCNSTISVYQSDSGTDKESYLTTLLYNANNGRQFVIQAPSTPNVLGYFIARD